MSTVTAATRHLTASMVVIDVDTAAVLLIAHKASGQLQFPGGHVDAEESPAEAALREVREETGVRAHLVSAGLHPLTLAGMSWQASPWATYEIPAPAKPDRGPGKPAEPPHSHIDQLFLGTADSTDRVTALEAEVSAAVWVGLAELPALGARADVAPLAELAFQQLLSAREGVAA
jgi:8-oxo-dGTP diphosphatase